MFHVTESARIQVGSQKNGPKFYVRKFAFLGLFLFFALYTARLYCFFELVVFDVLV